MYDELQTADRLCRLVGGPCLPVTSKLNASWLVQRGREHVLCNCFPSDVTVSCGCCMVHICPHSACSAETLPIAGLHRIEQSRSSILSLSFNTKGKNDQVWCVNVSDQLATMQS